MQSTALRASHSAALPAGRRAASATLSPLAEAAVAAERSRIGLDIHDGPIQGLTAAMLSVATVKGLLEAGQPDLATGMLAELQTLLAAEAAELRRVVRDLRPTALDHHGLAAAVAILSRRLSQEHGVPVELDVRGCEDLPEATEALAYRVVQQALANVGAHAAAGHASVRIARTARRLEVEVVDDGRGFDPESARELARAGHVGLASMRERAEGGGGTLSIWSRPGAGTRIMLRLPLPPARRRRP